ncbi:ammonium transporter 3 member 1 [Chenopodium quinoa]|uniref:ammonium transporter 3 member 1 n=1 Tax=Chenopodium quinoa TaxID=63459 RepID=UPI000B78B4DD|nr:ammonium transporter 3 member 1 [Chenopodium quinoa]
MVDNTTIVPIAYINNSTSVPPWLNKGDNAWQMIAATLVGLQSVPGLVILYGSIVKKKWAVNSAFMALYAFAAVIICWVTWAYKMSFGKQLLPFWGTAGPALGQDFLLSQSEIPESVHRNHKLLKQMYPMAAMVWYQGMFAAITMILLAGSLLGRMNIRAWMMFVPLWLTFSYTVGAFSLWGGGFLFRWGVLDYSGGYVIHVSSGIAGLTAAYWVGPRLKKDRERFPPNNVLLMLAGAGLLWLGWSGFNGGGTFSANIESSLAIINTNVCAATSLLMWTLLDVLYFKKPSVIGAVQGMMTGLVCITPGAGLVQGWSAIVMGILSGSIPWFTMMIVHKKWKPMQAIDDTLGVFHTHAVAGLLGGVLTGIFANPRLTRVFLGEEGVSKDKRGAIYGGGGGGTQVLMQIVGGLFVIGWNLVSTSIICVLIRLVIPLRMSEEELLIGDDAAHGEEAYALWGDGEKYDSTVHARQLDDYVPNTRSIGATQVV